MGVVSTW